MTSITVIHKSGTPQLPRNYRHISAIPLLCTLFAKLLFLRLAPILDTAQCPDQAGLRHQLSTEDHLFRFAVFEEKASEWQQPLWVAALDFKKVFGTVEHECLWEALREQRVPTTYIRFLSALYVEQIARVRTDKLSKHFTIERGPKQGDPLSSLLFSHCLNILCDKSSDNGKASSGDSNLVRRRRHT